MLKELNEMEEKADALDREADIYRRISDSLEECFKNNLQCEVDDYGHWTTVFKFCIGKDKVRFGHNGLTAIDESFESVMKVVGPEILKLMKFEFIRKERLCLLKSKSIRLQIFGRIIPESDNETK